MLLAVTFPELSYQSLWRNRLARSAVNRKVGGSSPPRDVHFIFLLSEIESLFIKGKRTKSVLPSVLTA